MAPRICAATGSALVAGICFSIVFGLSNGALVWGTKTILERMSPPTAGHASGGETGSRLAKATHHVVDPWLPRVGREIDARQMVGGLLFLPLLVGLRGLTRYLNAWAMASVSENVVNDLRCDV